MSLTRLLVGLAAVCVWFLVFEPIERRVLGRPGPGLRAPLTTYLADAVIFTLFGGLWFASLGSGGWLLLFLVLGLLIEGPGRSRHYPEGCTWSRADLRRLVLGLVRVTAAGGLLALCWTYL